MGCGTTRPASPLRIELMTTAGNRTRELIQQVAQGQWRQLGIETVIRNEPARVFFGETTTKRRFTGLALFAWISSPENVPRTTLHSQEIPSEANGWSGQNFTGLPEPARWTSSWTRSRSSSTGRSAPSLWHELQRIYAEELPALPLFFRADAHIWPKWLQGVAADRPHGAGDALGGAVAGGRRLGPAPLSGFLLRRLVESALVLLAVSFLVYGLIGLMPGDPIDLMLQARPVLHLGRRRSAQGAARPRPPARRALGWLAGTRGAGRFRLLAPLLGAGGPGAGLSGCPTRCC